MTGAIMLCFFSMFFEGAETVVAIALPGRLDGWEDEGVEEEEEGDGWTVRGEKHCVLGDEMGVGDER